MAQVLVPIPTAAPVTPGAAVAPATSEVITAPGWNVIADITIGGTATTVTIVRPGNMAAGDAVTDFVVGAGALTSTRRLVRIGSEYADPVTGAVTITFSQVTAVTWQILVV
jgi:hypothetical protein